MSILETEAAISKLPVSEVDQLMLWFRNYQAELWDKQIAAHFDRSTLETLAAEAKASGEPSPFIKSDIHEARRVARKRIEELVTVNICV